MVIISSPGGMGCSYLLESLERRIATNAFDDSDRLKHCPTPYDSRIPATCTRAVFVWNDPLKAILSLHRRGWLSVQCQKLEGYLFASRSCEVLWEMTSVFSRDVYGIENQAANWIKAPRWPTLFFDMRRIRESRDALANFLCCDASDLELLPRTTYDLTTVPADVQQVYQRLDEKVQSWGEECNWRTLRTMEHGHCTILDPALYGRNAERQSGEQVSRPSPRHVSER